MKNNNMKQRMYSVCFSLILVVFLSLSKSYGQTTIISATGDGGFENGTTLAANGWTGINGANGGWYFNTAVVSNNSYTFTPTGNRSLFFSNNSGTTWQYEPTTNTSGCSHFYRNVTFPAGQTNIDLSFRWNANGESSWDIIYVYLCPTTLTPTANSPSGSSSTPTWTGTGTPELIGSYNLLSAGSGSIANINIPASYAGTTARLVFSWKSDDSFGGEPPAAIDDISLISSTPSISNDSPCTAVTLIPGNCTPTEGDVLSATQSYAGCAGTANDDVWYKFVATATSHEIIVTPSADFDAVWQLYTGVSCASLTGTAICVDDYVEGGAESTIITGFTIGSTYYIRVYDYYTGYPATSTFTISVDKPYLLNASLNGTTVTECCTKLYDSGNASANYSNSENYTVTYQASVGQRIRMTFYEFATQANTDYLYIYDGPNTSSPLMFQWSGTPSYIPDAVSTGQYLTIRFTSNNNTNDVGFTADLKCENIPPAPGLCNGNNPASNSCSSSTQICDPNGYCGNTSSYFTPDLPGNMCSGCGLFGGSIENNSWISFTAAATTASLQFNVSNCANNLGIQFGIYSGSNCTGFALLTAVANTTDPQIGSQTITATGLTIGNTYYIMVDGFAGDVCNYTIDVIAGIMQGNISGASTVCYGQTGVSYTMNAAATGYSWAVPAGASITSGSGTNTITVNWGTATSGNITCTATAGTCTGASDSFAVTVTPTVGTPVFTLGATSTRCQGAGSVTYGATATNTTGITYTLDATSTAAGNSINASTGAVTYTAGWSGTSTITASAAGCNGPRTATHTVTITPTVGTPVFTLGATSTRCQGAGTVTYGATATNTTGITYTLDATSIAGSVTIVSTTGAVTYPAAWSGTTTITASAAGCNGPRTATHTVTITPTVGTPVFTLGATSTRCQGAGSVTYGATATNTTGITYSLDAASIAGSVTIVSTTGAVTYPAAWSGTTTITASAAGCNGPRTATHTVTITPTVGTPVFTLGATSTRCQGAGSVTYGATATNTTGITYTLDAASITGGVTIVPATGAVTYPATWNGTTTITASAAGCNGPRTATHTVTVTPTVTINAFSPATSTRCQGAGSVTYTTTANNSTGITYSLDAATSAAGNTINASTGVVTYIAGWSGTTTITANAAGCNGPASTTHTVTITPTVSINAFSPATSTRCQGAGNVTYTTTASNSTGITYSIDAASITGGNSINATTGVVTYTASWTGSTTITASAAGCNGPATTTHVVTITPTVTINAFSPATSTRCQGAGSVTYTATATNSTGITYSLDAASLTGGNTINSSTGAVTYVATWAGTTTITASAAGCNGPATTNHTVTVTPTVGLPVFTLGASTTRCQGAGSVTYGATATNSTGISYSLDAASISGGVTIVAGTGAVTYPASWSGTTTITASATGCNGPRTSSHTVTITPTVTINPFSPATSTRCQGAGIITTTTTANNSTGITYSLDAASLTGGNTINATTGAVTYTAGWSGTTTITASAAGCNGPATTTHIVTITPTVTINAFSPATSTRCRGVETINYATTANNSTGITYSLDAASITGGNTINATTGSVTYAAGWNGTTTITASAAGCNGPATTTHVVTVYPLPSITSVTKTDVTICSGSDGTITIVATGFAPLTYSINGGTSYFASGSFTGLSNGVYNVVVKNGYGCTVSGGSISIFDGGAPVAPTAGTNATYCTGAPMANLTAASSAGGILSWYSNPGLTTLIGTGTSIAPTNTIGTSNYYVTENVAGCISAASIVTIIITPSVTINAFSPATSTRCRGAGSVTYTTTANNSTGITYSLDAASITGGNTINATTGVVTYSAGWSGTTTITASAAGCNGPVTTTHVVTVTPTVTINAFSPATSTRCQGAGSVTYTTTANNSTGITYSLDAASLTGGNTINSATGAVNYSAGWTGTTTITASAAGCNGPATTTHVVTITPTVTITAFSPATSTRCQGAGSVTYTTTATNSTGITYSLDAASITGGNSINATTGAVTYVAGWSGTTTITANAAGCNGPASTTHVVTITPTVTISAFAPATSTRCQGAATITYATSALNSTGITYSLDASSLTGGNSINSATGAVTFVGSWSGTTTITASAAGCNGPVTTTHVVTVTPTVTINAFSPATSTRCQGTGTITYTTTGTNSTGITYSLDALSLGSGNSINASTGAVTYVAGWTGTTTITASAAGCNGPVTTTHVVTITPTVTINSFTPATSTRCQGVGSVTYSTTANNSTGITYSLDAASITGGNSINATTGAVSYVAGWSGTTTITASAAGCNGPATTTHVVTITPTVTITAFAPATSTRCQGAGTATYTTTATNSTGITYTLDAASITGGNSINATTGAVTYVAGWSGTTTITANAAGCNGPASTTHVVTITPTVTVNAFSPATSIRCQGVGTVTYTTTGTNTTGITYSLDAASIAAGNTINATTGAVNYVSGWSGTTTITASAAGCNGPAISTHQVTVTPTVTINAYSPATSTRCQGAGIVSYATTANNETGLTYSLDAASITGGNSINASTGDVTYAAGWSGTTTITASAAGCNGPSTTTHTVTVTATVNITAYSPATSTRCQGATTVNYTTTATNSTGITYSLDALSLGAGNTINSLTGAVTYTAGWSGTTTITASAAGCNGPATTIHTVTITPSVVINSFPTATSSRCQAAGSVTYTTSAVNSTGLTYSLDAASLAAGNTINATTGVVTYTATWNGTSTITATATGCNGPLTTFHVVTTNSLPSATATSTGILCNGGSVSVNVAGTGGALPYNGTGIYTQTAGTYNYIITDANSCTATTSITLTEPAVLTASSTFIPILCNGETSLVTVTATGGTSPYSNIGDYTHVAGTYSYTVTDAHGCIANTNVTITQPSAIVTSTSTTLAGCNLSDGTATVTASGGTGTLTYLWSPAGGTNSTTIGLPAGNYSVVTEDANGCSVTNNVSISNSGAPVISNTSVDIVCHGLNTGSIDLTVTGGTLPYTYNWNSGAYSTEDLTNIPAGAYTYNVTDGANCQSSGTITIIEPDTLTASSTSNNILCVGGTTQVSVFGSGGTGILSGTGNFTVPAGTYTYIVTDESSCTASTTIIVSDPPALIASSSATTLLCHGDTAIVTVSATGGSGVYIGTGSFHVTAGTYTYQVSDLNGCITSTSITVSEPDAVIASAVPTDILCFGGTSDITVSAIGGTGTYTGTGIYNETEGTYSYIVYDVNSCSDTIEITITEPTEITSSTSTTFAGCGLSDGTATVTATGGTGVLTYLWNPIGGTNATATALPAGNYTVEITDENGCTHTDMASVSNSGAPTSSTTQTDVLCFGQNNGTIDLTVSGGTSPYTYDWNNGAYTDEDLSNIPAGNYSYTVTDNANCQTTGSVDIIEPLVLTSAILEPSSPSCSYTSDGEAIAVASGGVPPYNFIWSDILNTANDTVSTLIGDTEYYVTITDDNGCTTIDTVYINNPLPVDITATIADALCGQNNGSITTSVSGGAAPYTYLWDNSQTTSNLINLSAGIYEVTVTDSHNCTTTDSYTVISTSAGNVTITNITNIQCFGTAVGEISISVNGGTPDFIYEWSNGQIDTLSQNTYTLSGLNSGNYSVTITDANNCISDTLITVSGPSSGISTNVTIQNITCHNLGNGILLANTTGGSQPYTYLWSNSQVGSPLLNMSAGTYSVTVTDANSCTTVISDLILTEPEEIIITASAIQPTCGGTSTGSGNTVVTGGVLPYTYSWSNQTTGSSISNVPAGTYLVTVTDANVCTNSAIVQITEPAPITVTYETGTNESTHAGFIDLTVVGGALPYNYEWSNNALTEDIENLSGGWYIYTITDGNTCQISDSIMVELALQIPNTITPNKDGKNDDFFIINIEAYNEVTIQIYNRWGNIVYSFNGTGIEYNQEGTRFDGTYNGAKLPMGSYVYIVTINSEDTFTGALLIKY